MFCKFLKNTYFYKGFETFQKRLRVKRTYKTKVILMICTFIKNIYFYKGLKTSRQKKFEFRWFENPYKTKVFLWFKSSLKTPTFVRVLRHVLRVKRAYKTKVVLMICKFIKNTYFNKSFGTFRNRDPPPSPLRSCYLFLARSTIPLSGGSL